MLDVLIFTASYGGGHRQAARALTKSLCLCRQGLRTEVADFMELISPTLNKVAWFTYIKSVRNTPSLYGYFYQVTDHIKIEPLWEKRLNYFVVQKILDFLRDRSPRLIVATYPVAAGAISCLKEQGLVEVPLVTVITDNAVHSQWIHPCTDLYLVGSEYVREGLICRGVPGFKIAVSGIPIDPKFARLPSRAPLFEKFALTPGIAVILVMTGAAGMLRGVPSICRMLDSISFPVQVLVVTGGDRRLYHRLQEFARRSTKPLRVYGFVENVEEFMAVADLLITKAGGLTTSEALAAGLPMFIYRPIPGQEAENTRYLAKIGAGLPVNNLQQLETKLTLVLKEPRFLAILRERARAAGRPEAALTAAHIILALAAGGYLPPLKNHVQPLLFPEVGVFY
ncbi:MAG: glycosyltransferase [Bacillota bacterium]|nr:glycosyltransferase [Bacillota bacterium]